MQSIELTDHGNLAAVFANGERHVGSILVGADGPRSAVRKTLFGAEKAQLNPLGATYVDATFGIGNAEKARNLGMVISRSNVSVCKECVARISVLDVPDAEKPETWQFHLSLGWKEVIKKGGNSLSLSNHEMLQKIKSKAVALGEPFSSAIHSIPDSIKIHPRDPSTWAPTPWHTRGGRITIAGDAAHTLAPHREGGLDHAIADAHSLVETVKGVVAGTRARAEAIPSYSRDVAARGVEAVEASRKMAMLMLDGKWESALAFPAVIPVQSNARVNGTSASPPSQVVILEESRLRNAWSRVRLSISNKIEYLDRGAEQGTAQTPWATLGHRAYARRHFPQD